MFNTKNAVDITEVPVSWVFEHYCNLPLTLIGQDVMIHSCFNTGDSRPSMSIHNKKGTYRFNDFSTGRYGDHIDLVQQLHNLGYHQACAEIATTYTQHVLNKGKNHKQTGLTEQ